MGTFDTITTSYGRFQTKAFGKGMANYHLGDEVVLAPVMDPYSPVQEPLGRSLPSTPEAYQVMVLSEREGDYSSYFLTVRKGRLVGVSQNSDESLPLYDYYGNPAK